MKIHDLESIIIDSVEIKYFYTREKNDINGNPRFRVFIIDPESPAVYEKIFKTYNLDESVRYFIEKKMEG